MMLLIVVFVLVIGICMGYFAYKARRHTLATRKSLWSAGIILVGITVVSCVFIGYTGHVSGEYVTLATPTEKATYYMAGNGRTLNLEFWATNDSQDGQASISLTFNNQAPLIVHEDPTQGVFFIPIPDNELITELTIQCGDPHVPIEFYFWSGMSMEGAAFYALVLILPELLGWAIVVNQRLEKRIKTERADEEGELVEDKVEERIDQKKLPKYLQTSFSDMEYYQCERCHKWPAREEVPRKCAACGISLCKDCYHAGFCKTHFFTLEGKDRGYVEKLARQGKALLVWFLLGIIASSVIPLIIGSSLSKLMPFEDFLAITLSIVAGGIVFSFLAVWKWERVLRARFWRVVNQYDFGMEEDIDGEVEDQSGKVHEEHEEKEAERAGAENLSKPPINKCKNCGWILTAAKSTCPRCGCPIVKE